MASEIAGLRRPSGRYSIAAQTSLDSDAEVTEGDRALATSAGVSIKATKPADATDKCFFKVLVNMTPKPANQATIQTKATRARRIGGFVSRLCGI